MSVERIVINEMDQSQGRVVLSDVFNVLVVMASDTNNGIDLTNFDPTLYENREEFFKKYGKPTYDTDGKTVKEYSPANTISALADLIDLGLGIYMTSDANVTKYSDKYRFDVAFILDLRTGVVTGTGDSATADTDNIETLISNRYDLLYLPADWTSSTDTEDDSVLLASTYGKGLAKPSYGALYSPSVKYGSGDLPGSYCFLRNFAIAVGNGIPAWYAMAGVNRGLVTYITKTNRVISDVEAKNCQAKNSPVNNYNPIVNLSSAYGNVIWGQRTLQAENTSLKSVNVRILCNMIKKRIFNISLGLLFDANDMVLWNEFRGQLCPYLDNMKYNRGLVDYEVIMDQASQDSAPDEMTVKGFVRIQPTRAAEYFDIDFILTSGNTSTSDESEE